MALNDKIERILKTPAVNREEIDLRTKEIISDIESGQTTGDALKDFVIFTHGMVHPDLEIPYRKLQESAGANIGNQAMVLREKAGSEFGINQDFFMDVMFPKKKEIGALKSSLQFDLKGKNLILPTDNYAVTREGCRERWELKEGPIKLYWFDMFNLEKGDLLKGTQVYDMLRRHNILEKDKNLKVLFGQDVENHFRKNSFGLEFINTEYVKALDILGLQAPSDFKEKYDRDLFETKTNIISEIERLCEEEAKYQKKIGGIVSQIGKSPFVEGKVDTFFMTWGEQDKVKEAREGIRRNIQKGLELKMHEQAWLLPWKHPGMMINVPEYMTGMCERYKIDIPGRQPDTRTTMFK